MTIHLPADDTSETERLRSRIAETLTRARARSAALTDCLDEAELVAQHSRLMSPLVWDLAHVGNQEELWLVRDVGGREPVRADIDELYDAFKHARANRPKLPLLDPGQAREYVATVREKVWDVLENSTLRGTPLVEGGFAFGMIAQHEQQHDETMLATHQLRAGAPVLSAPSAPTGTAAVTGEVIIPAGQFTMGTSTDPWALDNERPAHLASGGGGAGPPLRHTPTAAGAVLADVTRELREAAADWHEARTALRAHRHHSTLPHTPSPVDHPSRAGDEDV